VFYDQSAKLKLNRDDIQHEYDFRMYNTYLYVYRMPSSLEFDRWERATEHDDIGFETVFFEPSKIIPAAT
jgi:hypothetical protein